MFEGIVSSIKLSSEEALTVFNISLISDSLGPICLLEKDSLFI